MFPKAVHSTAQNNSIVGRFVLGPNIAFLNDHLWKSQRKIANPAFHRSMPVQLFGELTLQLFDVMEQTGSRVNVSDLIQRWTLDAIGKAGFGFDFKALAQKDNVWVRKYKTIVEASQQLWYAIFPVFDDRTSIWFWPGRRAVHQDMDEFLSMIDCVIQHKRDQIKRGEFQNAHLQENEKDLLTLMIESEHRGEGAMTDEELRSNMCVFFLAGHDTTSNTVAYAAYHLAMHPEIQQKAREEALTILGNEPVDILPTVDHTKQFVYINQVIKETLRINSPAPRINEREAVEDFLLSGTWIPKGTSVLVDLFSVHHSKKNWKDPEVFDPDRFDEDNENNGPRPGMAWVPFSSGARQCIGMNFSLYEQRVLLAMLLRKYIWTLPEDSIHKHGVISSGINIVGPVHLELEFQKRY
ncbi:cytochrome P-450 cyp509A1 [Gilbertella persicaria]|uniref:cytochrome P-450 cyp509A1 n=1 Tax=Gilbertella persicaria TaxID=101096 RepID=UPI002220F42E|nr:cytochrome P-450 cyp509A1 [Gilbertella persicaria]KAI8063411.1 cytochrome P-450 cyp509A1 [Gilbertella persicaria]